MKRSRFSVRAIAFLLLCLVLFTACASKGAVTLKYENGAYRNAEKGMAFLCAPICYRASSARVSEGAVAVLVSDYADNKYLYAIDNADSAKWLSTEDFTLYCAEGILLPSLAQMQPTLITNAQAGFGVSVINDELIIADIVETYEKGTTVPRAKIIPPVDERYEMVFSSDIYKGVLYVLECWRFTEDVKVYAKLTADGSVPDYYPGIQAEIVNGEAVFNLGKTLIYDRAADTCYPIGSSYNDYFPIE